MYEAVPQLRQIARGSGTSHDPIGQPLDVGYRSQFLAQPRSNRSSPREPFNGIKSGIKCLEAEQGLTESIDR